jgi:hypothetical protein
MKYLVPTLFSIALALAIIAFAYTPSQAAGAFELSRDTVWEENFFYWGNSDSVFLINKLNTNIIIDSIYVHKIKVGSVYGLQMNFMIFSSWQDPDNRYNSGEYQKIVIAGKDSFKLSYFQLDECVGCPLSKKYNSKKINDTLIVSIEFVNSAYNSRDTLIVIGIQQSTASQFHYISNILKAPHPISNNFNAAGRISGLHPPCSIILFHDNSKRIKLEDK